MSDIPNISKLDSLLNNDVHTPFERKILVVKADGGSKHNLYYRNIINVIEGNINGRRYRNGPLGAETPIGVVPVSPAVDEQGRPTRAAALGTLQTGLWFHETFSSMRDDANDAEFQSALRKNLAGLIGIVLESDASQTSAFSDTHLTAHPVYMVCANLSPDDQNIAENRDVVALLPIYDEEKINRQRKSDGLPKLTKDQVIQARKELFLLSTNALLTDLLDFEKTGRYLHVDAAPGSPAVYCRMALSGFHADLQEAHKVTSTNSCWCSGCLRHASKFSECIPPSAQPTNDTSVNYARSQHTGFGTTEPQAAGQSAAEAAAATAAGPAPAPASDAAKPLRTPEEALEKVAIARSLMNALATTMAQKKENMKKAEDFLRSFGLDCILLHMDNFFLLLPYCNIFLACYPDRLHQIEKGTAAYMLTVIRAALADRTLPREERFNTAIGDQSQLGSAATVSRPDSTAVSLDQRLHATLPNYTPGAAHVRIPAAPVIDATRSLAALTIRGLLSLIRSIIYDCDIRIVRLVSAQVLLWRALRRRFQSVASVCEELPALVYELQEAFTAFVAYSPSGLGFPKFHRLVHMAIAGLYFGRLFLHTNEALEHHHTDVKESTMKTNLNLGYEKFVAQALQIIKSVQFAVLEHERYVHTHLPVHVGPAAAPPPPRPVLHSKVVTPASMSTKAGRFAASLLNLLCSTALDDCERRLGFVASAGCAKHLLSCAAPVLAGTDTDASNGWPADKVHLRALLRRPNKDVDPERSQPQLDRFTLVQRLKACLKRELCPADDKPQPEWLDKSKLNHFLENEYLFLSSVLVHPKCKTAVLKSPDHHEFLDRESEDGDAAPESDDNLGSDGDQDSDEDDTDTRPEGDRVRVQLVAQHDYKRRSPSHSDTAESRVGSARMDAVRVANPDFGDRDIAPSATNPPHYIAQLILFLSIPAKVLQLLTIDGKVAPEADMIFTLHGSFREREAPLSWQIVEEGQSASRASFLLPIMIARDFGPSDAQEVFEYRRYRVTPVSAILNPVMIVKTDYLVNAPQRVNTKIPLYFLNIDVDC